MSRHLADISLLLAISVAMSGCIGAPPASPGPADADATAPVRDATSSADAERPDRDMRIPVADAELDQGRDGAGPDAGTEPTFLPLPSIQIGMVLDLAKGTDENTNTLLRHLLVGLNADVKYGSPAQVAGNSNHDLLWAGDESGEHYGDASISALAEVQRPIIATRTSAWQHINLTQGVRTFGAGTTVEVLAAAPAPAMFTAPGAVQVYSQDAHMHHRTPLGDGAEVVALNNHSQPTIFVYEMGAAMDADPPFAAPARRVGYAPDAYSDYVQGGWDLLDGSVLWALSRSVPPPLDCHIVTTDGTPEPDAVTLRSRLRLHGCATQMVPSSTLSITDSDLIVVMPQPSTSAEVGTALLGVDAPVLVLWAGTNAIEQMGLTAENPSDSTTSVSQWTLLPAADHRLRSGRQGQHDMATSQQNYQALPLNPASSTAIIVGNATGQSDRITYWAYDAGMELDNGKGIAAGRRVALSDPLVDGEPTRVAVELIDGAIQWLLAP